MSKVVDLEMFRGDTKTFDVFCEKPDPTIGTMKPIDLTGAKVWFTAKRTPTDIDLAAIVRLATPSADITVISAASGQARIAIPPASTVDLPDDKMLLTYDIQVKEATGELTTTQSGILTVKPDQTRAIT